LRKIFTILALAVIVASASCTSSKEEKGGRLARVFDPKMLSADLRYFEQVTGPAKITNARTKIYSVEGSEIWVTVANGSVSAFRANLSPQCSFDLNKFIRASSGKFPPLHTMTFGQFDALTGGEGQFMADCLTSCGNAADPVVYECWMGTRAAGCLEVMLEAVQVGEDVLAAAGIWRDTMEKGEGENWVIDTKFNCNRSKYDAIAHSAFKNIRVTGITIGYNIDRPHCY